jgi:hypothetical protein
VSIWLLTRIKHSGNLLCHGNEQKYLAVALSLYVTFQIVKYVTSAEQRHVMYLTTSFSVTGVTVHFYCLYYLVCRHIGLNIECFYALVETGGRQKVLREVSVSAARRILYIVLGCCHPTLYILIH